ncbi:hypothetical protein BOTBODRAFT_57988 [Botryobasidium botryosum FD-172 SS1]|uniref:CAP-Gly domain-containing protein n=1 Tax=Botryobasidium botryosum (strain FD-172 SS1) TaxID=930990 RepID=A0A067M486_BOTB1|nr:hypothetical protein BOTBODRAFT_57988 [Botryobasidium botryosum FD-172 SS1]
MMMVDADPPALPTAGLRLKHAGHYGTVRFVGEVDGSSGIWIGVEWDDPSRGKHGGSKNGKQYFRCRRPNSGSFIRPTSTIAYGRAFTQALLSKYIDESWSSGNVETLVLGSSNGAITVEAPGLDKIRKKFANIERLREISLEDEEVSSPGPLDDIKSTCRNVRGLNLSRSLLPAWEDVMSIATQLPALQCLILNHNRLGPLAKLSPHHILPTLQELRLNNTLTSWDELVFLSPIIPHLRHLQMGYNHLTKLCTTDRHREPLFPNLELLNLEGNMLDSWKDIMMALPSLFPKLDHLVLTSNQIAAVPSPDLLEQDLPILRQLSLTENLIDSWRSANALYAWLPQLEHLRITQNPIADEPASRQVLIAKSGSLKYLNGTPISSAERRDCELFYLSSIAKETKDENQLREDHPRWKELSDKYGKFEQEVVESDKLSNRLIDITLRQYAEVPEAGKLSPSIALPLRLRILPTMNLRLLRLKILKVLKKPPQTVIRIWLILDEGAVEMEMDQLSREVGYWGVEQDTDLGFLVPE